MVNPSNKVTGRYLGYRISRTWSLKECGEKESSRIILRWLVRWAMSLAKNGYTKIGLECPLSHCVYHPLIYTSALAVGGGSFRALRPHLFNATSNMLLGIVVPLSFVLFCLVFFGFGNPILESLTSWTLGKPVRSSLVIVVRYDNNSSRILLEETSGSMFC